MPLLPAQRLNSQAHPHGSFRKWADPNMLESLLSPKKKGTPNYLILKTPASSMTRVCGSKPFVFLGPRHLNPLWGFAKGPYTEEHHILEFILESPYLRKTPPAAHLISASGHFALCRHRPARKNWKLMQKLLAFLSRKNWASTTMPS